MLLGSKSSPLLPRRSLLGIARNSVRALARAPAERLNTTGRFAFDRVTEIHEPHIGDTRSGKWHDLPPPDVQSELTRRFEPFLKQFGYA